MKHNVLFIKLSLFDLSIFNYNMRFISMKYSEVFRSFHWNDICAQAFVTWNLVFCPQPQNLPLFHFLVHKIMEFRRVGHVHPLNTIFQLHFYAGSYNIQYTCYVYILHLSNISVKVLTWMHRFLCIAGVKVFLTFSVLKLIKFIKNPLI